MVVVAIGTRANPLLTATEPDLKLNKWGYIVVDEDGMTSLPGVFAGHVHEHRQTCPHGQEDRIEALAQLGSVQVRPMIALTSIWTPSATSRSTSCCTMSLGRRNWGCRR